MNVLHILEKGDERVLLGSRSDHTSHGQHILLASRLQFHLVHEILDADFVENAVRVNEQHEQVIVALEIFRVDLVDEFECPLLAVSFSTVGEPRNGDTAATIGHIDGLGVRIKSERNTKFLNGVEIELVLLVAVERKEDVQTRRRVVAVHQ